MKNCHRWHALPLEVRERVVARYSELYPREEDKIAADLMRRDLVNLAVLRLVESYEGDIAQAIREASRSKEGQTLLKVVGASERDWVQAINAAQARSCLGFFSGNRSGVS